MEIKLNWTDFKNNIDQRGLSTHYFLKDNRYYIYAFDGPLTFICEFDDDTTEALDYETNYMPSSNNKTTISNDAFASNVLPDGKVLYLKIHGIKKIVPASGEIEFTLTIPYTEAYLQGLEIFQDVLSQTDMGVEHPLQPGVFVEQYGYDVCMGKVIYEREAQYASRLPQGLIIKATVKNSEAFDQEFGVNFILHEVRDA